MKRLVIAFCIFHFTFSIFPAFAITPEAIEEIIGKMTLEEKIGQLIQFSSSKDPISPAAADASGKKRSLKVAEYVRQGRRGSLIGACGIENFNYFQKVAVEESRLGIPLLVGHDMIHGVKTQFPVPVALSCAWDEALWERCGKLIALETPLKGCNWTFAPMVDIARDARWGRIVEGAGQDPLLAGKMSAALVRGIQTKEGATPIAACLKHYVGYGAAFQGRDYNLVEMDESTLRNVYLPPFKAGVDAGALTVMPAFHTFNGVPCSMNRFLLTDVLRTEFGFKGFTISDWDAIGEMGPKGHSVADNAVDLSMLAINAGMDQDMMGGIYRDGLFKAVKEGKVAEKTVDEAVRRILTVKNALGLWEKPYIDQKAAEAAVDLQAHAALAREAAARSCVLLKNDGTLPLKPNAKIALVGPGLDDVKHTCGAWTSYIENKANATMLEGFKAAKLDFKSEKVYDFKKGTVDQAALARVTAEAEVIVAVFGEYGRNSGEGHSIQRLELPRVQREALAALKATGKPVVALLMGGRPLAIPELAEGANAILEAWSPGTSGGDGVTDVLIGKVNPSGRLTTEFPRTTGQMPLFYNRLPTGRPTSGCQVCRSTFTDGVYYALYPFGYGLSYTTFAYTNEQAKVEGDRLVLSCELTNTGSIPGTETVQAYTRQLVGVESRPVRELRGWQRVELKPGEKRTVEIAVPLADLAYWAKDRKVSATGTIRAWIGKDSVSGKPLQVRIENGNSKMGVEPK